MAAYSPWWKHGIFLYISHGVQDLVHRKYYSPLSSRIPHECVNVSKLTPQPPRIVYFYNNTNNNDNDR